MEVPQRLVVAQLLLTGAQRPWRSAEALEGALARRDPWPPPPPKPVRGVPVALQRDEGIRVDRLGAGGRGTVLALHGGCYVFGASVWHHRFWRTIAARSGRTVVAPMYRLAPGGTAESTVPHMARIAARLAAEEGPLALLGDSAGGGMALAVAQLLRDQDLRPPLLLSAPWLDGTLQRPWRPEHDPWLAVPGMRHAIDLYRGRLPAEHPSVSPLLGDLGGLGPIVVSSGTRDLLHADALRLADAVPGTRLVVGEGLLHNVPLLPIPQARGHLRALLSAL